ncbi:hypothetical protein GCM10009861_11480 [Neomicrococcus aestuarii]
MATVASPALEAEDDDAAVAFAAALPDAVLEDALLADGVAAGLQAARPSVATPVSAEADRTLRLLRQC